MKIKFEWRKHVHHSKHFSREKLFKRQKIQNRQFIWTKKRVEHINALNDYLEKLMHEVYEDCLASKNLFDKWILEGKSYYENYEITGSICILDNDEDLKYGSRRYNLHTSQWNGLE